MGQKITGSTRRELITHLKDRYQKSGKREKGLILDEFIKLTKCHRKHAIRLLGGDLSPSANSSAPVSRKIYDEAVREALTAIWEAADRICGKRLQAVMPDFVDSLQRHGHLSLDPELERKLLTISAASIDRLLSPVRQKARGRSKYRRNHKPYVKDGIPVRTFSDWKEPTPGYFEIDFVVHNGGIASGSCVHTLAFTDVSSGWTECVALVVREQSLVVEAIQAVQPLLPVRLLGIDTDNDSSFMNETVIDYCTKNHIELTRSRPYLKNDQAWIEQKNGAVVRHFVGYRRLTGILATKVLGRLHRVTGLYVNFFQPSFKLREKTRVGSKVHRSYFPPATPADRLLNSRIVNDGVKEHLIELKATLDPVRLLHSIRELQETLAALADTNRAGGRGAPSSKSLSEFLSQLPRLWKEGEVRATHRETPASPRSWRTRKDPFETVWPELLDWLQHDPDITANELFEKLRSRYPDRYFDGQLKTLQRRVQGWRRTMARELIGLPSVASEETLSEESRNGIYVNEENQAVSR